MEEANHGNTAEDMEIQYCSSRIMSPEIVEMVEDSKSIASNNRDGGIHDVYVAVGKDDLDVLKWVLDHAVPPGARVFLVHVFPAITYIPTPVGRLSRSQLSAEQVKVYINEEHNRRRNLLQKYIRLCNEAKVTVETMLLESNATAKAILELIPILNITNLVMGTKRSPHCSRLGKKMAKGEFVKKNAPEFCEVSIIHEGKKVVESQEIEEPACSTDLASSPGRAENNTHQSDWNFFECVCFSGKHLNRKSKP
ncbi:U-box domain-containing protein 33-like isoform X2 [Carya illinoinensis]|nr:U-box domain-containing protein 33-like isoform X2 [Carya illinoinensis]